MRNKSNGLILAVAAIAFWLPLSIDSNTGLSAASVQPTSRPWKVVLSDLGSRFDLYFSIELDMRLGTSKLDNTGWVEVPKDIGSADEAVKYLRMKLPAASIERNQARPQVINIVEKTLLSFPDYAMRKRATLDFAGKPYQLLDKISKLSIGTIVQQTQFTTTIIMMDSQSEFKIKVNDEPYRDILSAGVDLNHYSNIMWESSAWAKADGSVIVHVSFVGPKLQLRGTTRPATQP